MSAIIWEPQATQDFEAVLAKIPPFLRPIASKKVSHKAESLAADDSRSQVSHKDVISAFFMETPFGFHGPMKMDMDSLKIDYKKYGY